MALSQVDPQLLGVGVLVLLGVLLAFRGGARAGSRVARQSRVVSRMGGMLARAVLFGAVITAVQWVVVTTSTDPAIWAVALGLPAVFAGAGLARVFVVTTVEHNHSRTGARR